MTDKTTNLNDGEGLQIAHPEDFGVARDGEGELVPTAQRIPGTDRAVRVKPLVGGAHDRWKHVLEGDEADDEEVDAFLEEYIVEGIGSNGLQDVPDYLVPALIEAVQNSSGFEVFQKLQNRQQERNLKTIAAMDDVPDALLNKVLDISGVDENGTDDIVDIPVDS